MESNDFELAFSAFLDSDACDEAEPDLFAMARAAFRAGWRAAGGDIASAMTALS